MRVSGKNLYSIYFNLKFSLENLIDIFNSQPDRCESMTCCQQPQPQPQPTHLVQTNSYQYNTTYIDESNIETISASSNYQIQPYYDHGYTVTSNEQSYYPAVIDSNISSSTYEQDVNRYYRNDSTSSQFMANYCANYGYH